MNDVKNVVGGSKEREKTRQYKLPRLFAFRQRPTDEVEKSIARIKRLFVVFRAHIWNVLCCAGWLAGF